MCPRIGGSRNRASSRRAHPKSHFIMMLYCVDRRSKCFKLDRLSSVVRPPSATVVDFEMVMHLPISTKYSIYANEAARVPGQKPTGHTMRRTWA